MKRQFREDDESSVEGLSPSPLHPSINMSPNRLVYRQQQQQHRHRSSSRNRNSSNVHDDFIQLVGNEDDDSVVLSVTEDDQSDEIIFEQDEDDDDSSTVVFSPTMRTSRVSSSSPSSPSFVPLSLSHQQQEDHRRSSKGRDSSASSGSRSLPLPMLSPPSSRSVLLADESASEEEEEEEIYHKEQTSPLKGHHQVMLPEQLQEHHHPTPSAPPASLFESQDNPTTSTQTTGAEEVQQEPQQDLMFMPQQPRTFRYPDDTGFSVDNRVKLSTTIPVQKHEKEHFDTQEEIFQDQVEEEDEDDEEDEPGSLLSSNFLPAQYHDHRHHVQGRPSSTTNGHSRHSFGSTSTLSARSSMLSSHREQTTPNSGATTTATSLSSLSPASLVTHSAFGESSSSPHSGGDGEEPSYTSPPSTPGGRESIATFHSTASSSRFGAGSSVMSHRSSTSMSLLYGEVIHLGGAPAAKHNHHQRLSQAPSLLSTSSSQDPQMQLHLQQHLQQQQQQPYTPRFSSDSADLEAGGGIPGMVIGGAAAASTASSSQRRLIIIPSFLQKNHEKLMQSEMYRSIVSKTKQTASSVQVVTKHTLQTATLTARQATQQLLDRYRPPQSPRSRELDDLKFLQESHKVKLGQITQQIDMEMDGELEDHFDFVLVLTPQESYRFWSELLDFRVEHLGVEMESSLDGVSIAQSQNRSVKKRSSDNVDAIMIESASTQSTDDTIHSDDAAAPLTDLYSTPQTGMKRRRNRVKSSGGMTPSGRDGDDDSSPSTPLPSRLSSNATNLFSPYATTTHGRTSTTVSKRTRLSMFEKAIGISSTNQMLQSSPVMTTARKNTVDSSGSALLTPDAAGIDTSTRLQGSAVRRRWGRGHEQGGPETPNILSPPIRSLTRGAGSVKMLRVHDVPASGSKAKPAGEGNENKNPNPNRLESEEDIPNQVIPRGIAARTNGMLQFLSALNRGIVVRRHRPNKDPIFCKIFSSNGGDTIQYELVDHEEAMTAFKEQRVRYNRNVSQNLSPSNAQNISQPWSRVGGLGGLSDDSSPAHHFKLPDYVAAQRYREKLIRERGYAKRLGDLAKKAANSGIVRAADIVAVHPAAHLDPRHPGARNGELGTATLRKSKADFLTSHSFSIVSEVNNRFNGSKTTQVNDGVENKWYTGQGKDIQFKILDFEAATEGEYWLIFRGFLLLHRDAAVGRFAADRRAGIGGGMRVREPVSDEESVNEEENRLHRDEFLEPVTVGLVEKMVVKYRKLDDTYMKGHVLDGAVPPPSDYFLGFRSPGTQIWSRLRLAGLETQRIYAVDTRKVMIKVRCPEDRLTDVAEVLRLKMKTHDGTTAAFREDTADMFQHHGDMLDVPSIYHGRIASLLRSKDRQTIIDFIIGSRIRDSGAELAQTTDVGRMIQARVPLHMHSKLNSLYTVWVKYWKPEFWTGRDGRSLSIGKDNGTASTIKGKGAKDHIPNWFERVFVGAFYQPLDSIEEYFGEQVTFYFAWLQHCAAHLLFLSGIGLLVTAIQAASNSFDHSIRPFFAMVVMLWTFVVLINWRKRSNYLAHRWGTMDLKVQETTRPEFHGKYVVDDITKEWVVRYPKWKRYLKYLISFPVSVLFTGVGLLLVLMVHANRDLQMANYVQRKLDPENTEPFVFEFSMRNVGQRAPIVDVPMTKEFLSDPTFWVVMGALPAILGLCIPIMNLILMKISVMLNNFENYPTESEYRTHLIIKVFSFRFVSQFGTVYYYALISMGSDQAIENGILRMGTSLLIYTTVAHWFHIFLQVYFFMFIRNIRKWTYQKKLRQELRKIELEEEAFVECGEKTEEQVQQMQMKLINQRMLLDQAQDELWFEVMNPMHNSFPEYITAVIQFTFVACFSVVLPIVPVFCLFNYLLSMRYDAYKLCKIRRRPLARKTGGIGVWEHLLHIVAVIAVLTNCWLMGFTNKDFTWLREQVGPLGIFGVVVAWEHIMLLIKYIMQTNISPLPKSVRDKIKREQHDQERERQNFLREKNGRRNRAQSSGESPDKNHPKSTKSDSTATVSNASTSETIKRLSMPPRYNSVLNTESVLRSIPSADEESTIAHSLGTGLYEV